MTVVQERRLRARPRGAVGRALLGTLRRHWALTGLVVVGAVLRVIALVAIYPGIWFSDSNDYVHTAATGTLSVARVTGYSLVVAPFWQLGSAGALIVTQHLIALGLVVLMYALLLRRRVPRPLAVLAVVPLALDAYLIDVEHAIMSETVFHAALIAAIALLLWGERLRLPHAAGAGVLLAYAALTRSVAMPFVAVFVLYLLLRRVGWKPMVVFAVAWVLPICGYAALYDAQHGKLGLNQYAGRFLYAKTAPLADCARMAGLPARERPLCPDPRHRRTPNGYLWGKHSPIRTVPLTQDGRLRDFATRVIRDRPGAYLRLVFSGFFHYFEPGHRIGRNDYSDTPWRFPRDPRRPAPYPGYRGPIRAGSAVRRVRTFPNQYVSRMVDQPRTNVRASRFLHGYQRFAYTSGQVLAACVVLVLIALVLRRGAWRLRLDAALLVASVLAALLMASALSVFSYRYALTAVVLLPAAAALAATALLRPRVHQGIAR